MSPIDAGSPRESALVARLVASFADDARVVAAFLGGSRARGEADEHSDVDVCAIVTDDAYASIVSAKDAFVRRFGEPLFVEDFGNEQVAFVIFEDGSELELHIFRKSDLASIRSGPHRVLFDGEGILAGMEFPVPELDRQEQAEELRRTLLWFWHDVGHLASAIGRNQLWWAAGQLEQLRHSCVNLVRLEQDVAVEDEPYWKLDVEISTTALDELRPTFVPIEREALLKAGREVVAFFRRRAPSVARREGLDYPTELAELMTGHLDQLNADQP